MEQELRPCPFCGSENVSVSYGRKKNDMPFPYIECSDCTAMVQGGEDTEKSARDAWNTRVSPPVEAEGGIPKEKKIELLITTLNRMSEKIDYDRQKLAEFQQGEDAVVRETAREIVNAHWLNSSPSPSEEELSDAEIISEARGRVGDPEYAERDVRNFANGAFWYRDRLKSTSGEISRLPSPSEEERKARAFDELEEMAKTNNHIEIRGMMPLVEMGRIELVIVGEDEETETKEISSDTLLSAIEKAASDKPSEGEGV